MDYLLLLTHINNRPKVNFNVIIIAIAIVTMILIMTTLTPDKYLNRFTH